MRLVHVSDIHFGHGPVSHRLDQEMVFRAMVHDVKLMRASVGPPDWICLTGDVAYSGGALSDTRFDEYETAAARLRELGEAANVNMNRVLLIPGNHDVDRTRTKGVGRVDLHNESRGRPSELDLILGNDDNRELLLDKFKGFARFVSQIGGVDLAADFRGPGVTVEQAGFTIVGVNTALTSDEKDSIGTLCLGNTQLVRIDRVPREEFLILLAHHPPNWLADGSRLVDKLRHRSHLLLTGHEHTANLLSTTRAGGGGLVHITSGAVHGEVGDVPRHSYAWVSLQQNEIRYWPRVWNRSHDQFIAAREDYPDLSEDDSLLVSVESAGVALPSQPGALRSRYCQLASERLRIKNDFFLHEYIPLHCTRSRTPLEVTDAIETAIAAIVSEGPAPDRLAFLGDFGCGKTCFCQALFLRLADAYKHESLSQAPILLRLSRANDCDSPEDFVRREMESVAPGLGSREIAELLDEGALIFILDALDEMPRNSSLNEIRRCLNLIDDLHEIGRKANHTILTSRTTFFKTQSEEGRLGSFEISYFKSWGETEWRQCLETARLGHHGMALSNIFSVADLIRKPFFVRLIIENHDALLTLGSKDQKIFSADLSKIVDRVLAYQVRKSTSTLDEREKRQVVQEIALAMFFRGESEFLTRDVP